MLVSFRVLLKMFNSLGTVMFEQRGTMSADGPLRLVADI